MNYKKSRTLEDDDNAPKIQKSKRQRTMLTTNEKLRRKPNENETTFIPDLIDPNVSSFNINQLFSTTRPSSLLTSMYSGKSLAEEMKASKDRQKEFDEKKKNEETIEVHQSFLHIMDEFIKGGSICPEFKGFVAERDKVDKSNDDKLDGIEYRFDPNDHQFQNISEESVRDDNEPYNNELDKRKEIEENTDMCIQLNIKQGKTKKKRNQVKRNKVKINWLNKGQIDEILKSHKQGKNELLPRTLQKWDERVHKAKTQTIDDDLKYKFEFLQYLEIKPDWWIHKNRKKGICSEASNSSQNINACGGSIVESLDSMEYKDEEPKQLTNENDDGTDDELEESGELNSDECTQQNFNLSKINKKRNKVKINWLNKGQIDEILKSHKQGKNELLPRTLQNWDERVHKAKTQTIDDDLKYKFEFLQYLEIKPDWWIHKNRKKGICSEASSSSQNINDCGESIVESLDLMEIDDEDPEQLINENDDGTDDKLDESGELNSDECTQQNFNLSKINKKRNKVKINWLNKGQIDEILKSHKQGKNELLPRILQNWDERVHKAKTQTIDDDLKYKFEFLQYLEIKPDWWIHKNRKKGICSEASNSSQNINACGGSIVESLDSMEYKDEEPKQLTNENDDGTDDELEESGELNSDDEDVMGDNKSEDEGVMGDIESEDDDVMGDIKSEDDDVIGNIES